jgi:molybdate transport system substrate-binding protein
MSSVSTARDHAPTHTGDPPRRPQRRTPRRPAGRSAPTLPVLLLVVALPLLAGACGGSASSSGNASPQTEIRVFAAASLTDAFTKLGTDFSAAHPGVKVAFNFAGSQDLVAQLQQGAPADVLATADTATMDKVADAVGTPQVFASNKLEIAVGPGNPKQITGLADLADSDLEVVLAAPEVPAGKYAQQVLDKAGVDVKPVSLEENVKGVVTKVSLGEADAGIVYVTDVTAAKGKVDGVVIPESQNVIATYPIAVVKASERTQDAQSFVDMVLSSQGQETLQSFGFLPPPQ